MSAAETTTLYAPNTSEVWVKRRENDPRMVFYDWPRSLHYLLNFYLRGGVTNWRCVIGYSSVIYLCKVICVVMACPASTMSSALSNWPRGGGFESHSGLGLSWFKPGTVSPFIIHPVPGWPAWISVFTAQTGHKTFISPPLCRHLGHILVQVTLLLDNNIRIFVGYILDMYISLIYHVVSGNCLWDI